MTWDAARERELCEQSLHALLIWRNVRVNLAVGSFEVGVRDQTRTAMSRAGDVDHIEIVLLDHPVQVSVNKVQARRRPPMTEKPRLDVFFRERLLEQWVVIEIDLTDRKIVGCSPVRVD